jgi:hypothetical protein
MEYSGPRPRFVASPQKLTVSKRLIIVASQIAKQSKGFSPVRLLAKESSQLEYFIPLWKEMFAKDNIYFSHSDATSSDDGSALYVKDWLWA